MLVPGHERTLTLNNKGLLAGHYAIFGALCRGNSLSLLPR